MARLDEYKKSAETLIDETALLLNDPLCERWSRSRIKEALNDAVLDFCLRAQMIKEELNVRLREDVVEYDIKKRVEEDDGLRDYGFPTRFGFNGTDAGMWPVDLATIDLMGYQQSAGVTPHRWHLGGVSPGKVVLFGGPAADGESLPSEEGNMQVTYIAFPAYMDGEGDYPDAAIPVGNHQAFPYGAAARLLDEGDAEDLRKAIAFDVTFHQGVLSAVSEDYRSMTTYDDARPA